MATQGTEHSCNNNSQAEPPETQKKAIFTNEYKDELVKILTQDKKKNESNKD